MLIVHDNITIVGAGQSGLQLAIGLLAHGYQVRVVSERTPAEIAAGRVTSSQGMFGRALRHERALGLNLWNDEAPSIDTVSMTIANQPGGPLPSIRWTGRLDSIAQSVDQRVKMPRYIEEFIRRGGEFVVGRADVSDLETYARDSDLVVVAAGKGDVATLFTRDGARSTYVEPQRALALTYVRGMEPRPAAVSYNILPGVGEYFVFPALTLSGPCDIMVFEGIPGGPMDCWTEVKSASEHLEVSKGILKEFLPWEADRCHDVTLTDPLGVMAGRFTPVVRHPVAVLPSGAQVLGMADVVVLNDPLTGQGSNNASKSAAIYLEAISAHDGRAFDREFMQRTFERYWDYAQYVTKWTNAMLEPPEPHAIQLHIAAMEHPEIGDRFANALDYPPDFFSWYLDAENAAAYLTSLNRPEFDPRDLRRALGQFATGVNVVTARGPDGVPVGMTVNSFSSASLDPPMVTWCVRRDAPSARAFTTASHFAVHVLDAAHAQLAHQFSKPAPDKFAGVALDNGLGDTPVLLGAIAHFECRNVRTVDVGDHIMLIGEVERYEARGGEPLIFHSGGFRCLSEIAN
jgi:flavin reductase (DIM6/NTAB) family NADH-FMN oxidoreductase RutF/2-polyprenyl-6-methoxyphenol hydroxylase-like FAD-dependent oxidoreductase